MTHGDLYVMYPGAVSVVVFSHHWYYFLQYDLEFEHIYKRLGITVEERGESFYHSMMSSVIDDLESKGKRARNQKHIPNIDVE